MQISRHWRLNAQRYRLEGYRNDKGSVSLKPRPQINVKQPLEDNDGQREQEFQALSLAV
jgi:hypothetical protein